MDSSGKRDTWYRLDNAAQIYPAIIGKKDSCVFRIAVNLKEDVVPEVLQAAIIDCKPRFPTLYVKLKKGFFWYYYEPNEKEPILKKESPHVNQLIEPVRNNEYLFTFFHFKNRVSLECFHGLCDGSGAIEFLKAVVFRYFELSGCEMDDEGKAFTIRQSPTEAEIEDSFRKYYTAPPGRGEKTPRAYHIRDARFPEYYNAGIIVGRVKTERLLELARSMDATITEYLSALLTYCVWENYKDDNTRGEPINISVPVNMRKFFESRTLRNFSLFFYTSTLCSGGDISFDGILASVKRDFESAISKSKLQQNLNSNVSMEKKTAIRICPVFVKDLALKTASSILGDSLNTITLSNVGSVDLPSSLKDRIIDFECNLSCDAAKADSLAIISSNGTTTLGFSRAIYKTMIEKSFFGHLARKGIDVDIASNFLENAI